jgi:hypothetical protein
MTDTPLEYAAAVDAANYCAGVERAKAMWNPCAYLLVDRKSSSASATESGASSA